LLWIVAFLSQESQGVNDLLTISAARFYPFSLVRAFSGKPHPDRLPLHSDRGSAMNLTSNFDWAGKLNISAACLSFSFICAIVIGLV
jgi:hypothetical protein